MNVYMHAKDRIRALGCVCLLFCVFVFWSAVVWMVFVFVWIVQLMHVAPHHCELLIFWRSARFVFTSHHNVNALKPCLVEYNPDNVHLGHSLSLSHTQICSNLRCFSSEQRRLQNKCILSYFSKTMNHISSTDTHTIQINFRTFYTTQYFILAGSILGLRSFILTSNPIHKVNTNNSYELFPIVWDVPATTHAEGVTAPWYCFDFP